MSTSSSFTDQADTAEDERQERGARARCTTSQCCCLKADSNKSAHVSIGAIDVSLQQNKMQRKELRRRRSP